MIQAGPWHWMRDRPPCDLGTSRAWPNERWGPLVSPLIPLTGTWSEEPARSRFRIYFFAQYLFQEAEWLEEMIFLVVEKEAAQD